MRDLNAKRNILTIRDSASGDEHELYYRTPTNAEVVGYMTSQVKRNGNQLIQSMYETRLKFGALILEGFKKGTFGCDGTAFSSDPKDIDFCPEWKDLLIKHAGDVVSTVAFHAFEGTQVVRNAPVEDVDNDFLG